MKRKVKPKEKQNKSRKLDVEDVLKNKYFHVLVPKNGYRSQNFPKFWDSEEEFKRLYDSIKGLDGFIVKTEVMEKETGVSPMSQTKPHKDREKCCLIILKKDIIRKRMYFVNDYYDSSTKMKKNHLVHFVPYETLKDDLDDPKKLQNTLFDCLKKIEHFICCWNDDDSTEIEDDNPEFIKYYENAKKCLGFGELLRFLGQHTTKKPIDKKCFKDLFKSNVKFFKMALYEDDEHASIVNTQMNNIINKLKSVFDEYKTVVTKGVAKEESQNKFSGFAEKFVGIDKVENELYKKLGELGIEKEDIFRADSVFAVMYAHLRGISPYCYGENLNRNQLDIARKECVSLFYDKERVRFYGDKEVDIMNEFKKGDKPDFASFVTVENKEGREKKEFYVPLFLAEDKFGRKFDDLPKMINYGKKMLWKHLTEYFFKDDEKDKEKKFMPALSLLWTINEEETLRDKGLWGNIPYESSIQKSSECIFLLLTPRMKLYPKDHTLNNICLFDGFNITVTGRVKINDLDYVSHVFYHLIYLHKIVKRVEKERLFEPKDVYITHSTGFEGRGDDSSYSKAISLMRGETVKLSIGGGKEENFVIESNVCRNYSMKTVHFIVKNKDSSNMKKEYFVKICEAMERKTELDLFDVFTKSDDLKMKDYFQNVRGNDFKFINCNINNTKTVFLCLVTEVLEKFQKKMSVKENDETDFLNFLVDIAEFIKCLHKKNWIHGDIKPSNIMKWTKGNDDGDVDMEDEGKKVDDRFRYVLVDFGTTVQTRDDDNGIDAYGNSGLYSAPEVREEKKVYKSSDIFSFGMTINAVCDSSKDFIATAIFVDEKFKDMIQSMIQNDRTKRPTIEVVENAFKSLQDNTKYVYTNNNKMKDDGDEDEDDIDE